MGLMYRLYLNCDINNIGNTSVEVLVTEHEITNESTHFISFGVGCTSKKRDLDKIPTDNRLNIFAYTLDAGKVPDMIERMKTQMLATIEINENYFKMCKAKLMDIKLSQIMVDNS